MSRAHQKFSSPRTRPFDPRKSRPHQFEVGTNSGGPRKRKSGKHGK